MFTVLCKVSKQTDPAKHKHQKGAGLPFSPLYCKKKKKRIFPCHSYSFKRKLLLFVKEALKSSDMKGKSSLREEGHGVRGEIKGAIFPPRRESSAGDSPNPGEGLLGAGRRGQRWGPGLKEAAGPQAVPAPTQAPFSCQRRERMQRGEIPCFNAQNLISSVSSSRGNITVGEEAPPQAGSGMWRDVGCRGRWVWGALFLTGAGGRGYASSMRSAAAVCGEPRQVMEGTGLCK